MEAPSQNTATACVLRFHALHRWVADIQRAVAFYCEGLGFRIVGGADASGKTALALGAQRIVLVQGGSGSVPMVSGTDVRFQHVAIVARDMDAAFERLQKLGPQAISRGGPQRLPEASGGACAFKFRDPDGHPVELIEFGPGHGAPCWAAAAQRDAGPTLGIDHAAISVASAERSIAFYEELGFRLDSRQVNRGAEQARLDGLPDAEVEVEVVALVPPQSATPHLELLAYRRPAAACGSAPVHATADRLVWQADARQDDFITHSDRQAGLPIADPDGHLNGMVP
ncbi:MAG: VOC family protein [Burkholderiaceae bacterium]